MSVGGRLRFAVVGLGFGAIHARVLDELAEVELVALCDADAGRLQETARGRGARTYTDYAVLFNKEQLDAAVIALPARLHVEAGLTALAAGCALLVEKPLAPSLPAASRLVAAAAAAGVALMPGHIERFNPAVGELVRRVRAGAIGRVLHMSARRMAPIVVRSEQDVNVVHDSALHDIDVMRLVAGAEVSQVYAESHAGLRTRFEDSVSAVLRFGNDGPVGSIEVNWLSARPLRDLTVMGEAGVLTLDYTAQTLALHSVKESSPRFSGRRGWSTATDDDAGAVLSIAVAPREPLVEELTAFVAALRDGSPLPVAPADGLAAVAIADALSESARSGRPARPEAVEGSGRRR